MTNTTYTTDSPKFREMLAEYRIAERTFMSNHYESRRARHADLKMDRLMAKAEAHGLLHEFCRAI